jgi:hypothetical protein
MKIKGKELDLDTDIKERLLAKFQESNCGSSLWWLHK